jgi:putative Na+/H+ antiporter
LTGPPPSTIEVVSTVIFVLAIVHTFSTKIFERLAHRKPQHAGLWHLLGEVEVVFGFWAMVLVLCMVAITGSESATEYLDTRNFTEPMFVFAVMVIAGSRPILELASAAVRFIARRLWSNAGSSAYFTALAFVPLLGSFITEPAAMTLAAIILREQLFSRAVSARLKYATLAVLFVNVSIGGTLTPYAAPPVIMVANAWGWDLGFMFSQLGWKAALAVVVNALGVTAIFRAEIPRVTDTPVQSAAMLPPTVTGVHLFFLVAVVVFAHHPAIFIGLLLFFLGFTTAYERYQSRLILREGLLVAFFLGGLVVLGGQQRWWLQPLLTSMNSTSVYWGATALTAITDNAALTYLGSLVEGLSDEFKYALVAGAVTGGGLTVIANAPNPAGLSILRAYFEDGMVNPLLLFVAAVPPTLVAALAFLLL